MKARWLNRRIASPGPYLTLCLSEAEFHAAMKDCGCHERPPHVNSGADATTHHLLNRDGNIACIVCLSNIEGRTGVEIAGLLVHEAVHVWQAYRDSIGEKMPGTEQEAYAIQNIAQELMGEYARRTA